MVDDDAVKLKEEFLKIKGMGLIKLMRGGSTGYGYTFETLLGKKEDQECKPDFGSIEIKCKFGFSNTHFTLFTCAPKCDYGTAYNYIFYNYAYEKYNNPDEKIFSLKMFSHYVKDRYGFTFKLYVNDYKRKVFLKAYLNNEFLEDICYWPFDLLEEKVYAKLQKLALVDCFPYKVNNENYVKYYNITFYKLKSFQKFLNLIKNDTICVELSLKETIDIFGYPIVDCHGFQFRIRKENIERLFEKLNF